MKKIFFILILFLIFNFSFLISALAVDLSSPSYHMEVGDVNVSQPEPAIITKSPQKPAILGISYPKVEPSLVFSLSESFLSLQKIAPNNPEEKTIDLSVRSGKNQGFTLTIAQDNPPKAKESLSLFPEFSGDSGNCEALKTPCTWVAGSTYGLGFRLEGPEPKSEEFKEKTSFKKIPIITLGDPSGALLTKDHEGKTEAKLSLKTNLPKSLIDKNWEGTIIYTVLPTY